MQRLELQELAVDTNRLWCDATAFLELAESGRAADALELYRGELLPSFYVQEAPAFDEWLEGWRSRRSEGPRNPIQQLGVLARADQRSAGHTSPNNRMKFPPNTFSVRVELQPRRDRSLARCS